MPLYKNKPWNSSWGKVGFATKTTSQNGITSLTDVTDLSVTWTAVSGRQYKLTSLLLLFQNTSGAIQESTITNSANAIAAAYASNAQTSEYVSHACWAAVSGLSGSVTYKVRLLTTGGTVNVQASATQPSFLLVEDIGPA